MNAEPETRRHYRVEHRTTYHYGALMTDGYTVGLLTPRATPHQSVRSVAVTMSPTPSTTDTFEDAFGNQVTYFGLHEPHSLVEVVAVSEVDLLTRQHPVDDTPWEQVVDQLARANGELAIETGMFRSSSALVNVELLRDPSSDLQAEVFTPGRSIVDVAAALNQHIFTRFEFDAGFSSISTPLDEVLTERRGVCQDFAHLAVGALRSVGLAARYVSGYIETFPPAGQQRLVGADASHAWCQLWTPHAGWVNFDPTNGHLPVNDHIITAWGRDYSDVTPVRGIVIGPGTDQQLDVSVDVARQD